MTIRIGLDAMGGDHAPDMVLEGAVMAAAIHPEVEFILVGREEVIQAKLTQMKTPKERFTIRHASQVVGMGEKPAYVLRNKKDSSIRVGIDLVKEGVVDALVSAGNTGALMATAKFILKTLPGIDRPAIASILPATKGETLMLDLGANVDCSIDNLCQFALMGEIYATTVMGLTSPRIGLLNVGEEEAKGTELVRLTGERLRRINRFYTGNVEGTDIFLGDVDVVVCDGFVGNISLKTSEGVAQMLTQFLKNAFGRTWMTRLAFLAAKPVMNQFRNRFDHRKYNGAILLGLNGVVVKSHGSADAFAFQNAIQVAVNLVRKQVNSKIRDAVVNSKPTEVQP